jgi:hypothetical protein
MGIILGLAAEFAFSRAEHGVVGHGALDGLRSG